MSAAILTALDRWLAAHGSSGAELAGFVFGVLNVWLVTRQHIWSWPVGIANAAFYVVVFARAGLYSDTGLQALYIALSVYGWVQWLRGGPGRTPLRVSRTTAPMATRLAVAGLAGWALLATITARLPGSSLPALDAALVSGSLVAQFMMTRKLRESWLVWITVDVIYVGMFVYKQLLLTAVLYGVFTLLAVHGHRAWSRSLAPTSPASS